MVPQEETKRSKWSLVREWLRIKMRKKVGKFEYFERLGVVLKCWKCQRMFEYLIILEMF